MAGNHELSLEESTWEEAAEYMDQAGEARQSTEQVQKNFFSSFVGQKIIWENYGRRTRLRIQGTNSGLAIMNQAGGKLGLGRSRPKVDHLEQGL